MTDTFETWVEQRGGFFRRGEAIDIGYRDEQLRAAVRSGHLVRLRHGYYAYGTYVDGLDDLGRYALLSRACAHRLGPDYVLVGVSACIAHGIELYNPDLSTVHVARLSGRLGRREAGIHYHERTFDPDTEVVDVGGVRATAAHVSLWSAACTLSVEGAFVAANSALHQEAVTTEALLAIAPRYERWSGSRTARIAFGMADERIESVGESRTFFLCWEFHLPRPEPQYEVRNESGLLLARSDFAWVDYRHLGEFDGMVKYVRYLRPGESPSDVVVREKRREDLVRDESYGMSRVIWIDLYKPSRRATARSIGEALERSARLYTRNRTIITP